MLRTKDSGNTNPNLALLGLKPRQVMLAEQSTKTTTTTTMTMKKNDQNKTLTLNPDQKDLLLHSVLRYLDRNGFSKTLKRFLSEAQIENDNWKTCSLHLEDMYCKYLETCCHTDTNFNTYKEQELQTNGITKKDGDYYCDYSEKTTSKKKKKRSDENDSNAAADQFGAADKFTESIINSKEILANDRVTKSNVKLKEKKKSKHISDSLGQMEQVISEVLEMAADDTVSELQINESTKKHKDKKKKKSKLTSESLDNDAEQEQLCSLPGVSEGKSKDLVSSKSDSKTDSEATVKSKDKKKKNKYSTVSLVENVEQCGLEDKQGLIADKLVANSALGNTPDIPLKEKKVKSKDKKRRKEGSVSERLSGEVAEVVDKENLMITDSTKECFKTSEDATKKEKKGSKKRKRLACDENENQTVEKVATEESKRRKTECLEEAKSSEQITKVKHAFPEGDGCAGEESKGENGQVGHNESQKTFIKQLDEHANGKLEKNGGEKSGVQKTMRKQKNGSVEPKTVNAFQRVKVDEVEFVDGRLQDNSYWAKDGAEVGYGAKAQEVLGQVRGRDFRHEKTKKKRGSYRGGLIDLQSHSVKFNYSDDD